MGRVVISVLCVLIVEGMSVVVNVMLYLMSVMSPPPVLCNLQAVTVVKLCTLGVCFRGELGFLNCDDICMCVVNNQFELLEFVFDSVYDGLQYDEIYLNCTAGSVSLRECKGERVTAMLVWGGVDDNLYNWLL